MKSAIWGIDFGLSKINSTLIDLDNGSLLAEAEEKYAWDVQADNVMETNPEQLWEISQQAAEKILAAYDSDRIEIKGIVLSCFGETIVPVDENGRHLYPIMGSNDIRAVAESEAIAGDIPDYPEITGGNVSPASGISKILWLKNHKEKIFAQAKYFYSLQEYILKKMGLDPVNDYTLASRKMMLDIRTHSWPERLLRYMGLEAKKMGECNPSSYIAGTTEGYGRARIAGRKLPVVIGAHDAGSSALGLGIHPYNRDRIIGHNSGTWCLMNLYWDAFVNTAEMAPKLTPGCGPVDGSYYFQAAGAVGPVLDWYIRTFTPGNMNEISRQAVYDGSCKVRLTADPMEGDGVLRGLSLVNSSVDVFAGIIESITFPLADMLEQFQNLAGKQFDRMRISAGGAKADNWVQLKANVLNLTMERVANLQASAVGAAINAAVGIGYYKDYKEAIAAMVQVEKVFEPQPELVRIYEEKREEFKAMDVKGPCFFL